MAEVFDIYTIIFLALAVFIFLRLRSVLGQRTGRERPPYDPYSSREVFDGFDAAITEREGRNETAETRFVSIDGSAITAAELRNRTTAQITVRFVSKLISATRDRTGAVIDGNAEKVTDVTDVWTFARDISSRDPNWKVIATEAGQ